jgi:hypothetical protein
MQSRSYTDKYAENHLINTKERVLERLKTKTVHNQKLYVLDLGFKELPKSIYKYILKHKESTLQITGVQITAVIQIKDLKNFRGVKVKRLCAYCMLNGFTSMHIAYILNLDDTLSVHRRLVGIRNETI